MRKRPKGIYCLEIGEWYGTLKKKTSVESLLQLLRESPLEVPYIHRDIATEDELTYYIQKWTQSSYGDYPILYLAFHGSPGCIYINSTKGREKEIKTDDFFKLLKGKCHKRIIHFGSCKVLDINGHTAKKYLDASGAVAISGYTSDVDWVLSSVFEMYYLSELQDNKFTKSGMQAVDKRLRKRAAALTKELKFKLKIKP